MVVGEQTEQQETEETDTQETGEEETTPEEESQEVVVLGSDEEQVCVDTEEVVLECQQPLCNIVDESLKGIVLPFYFRNHKNMKRESQNMRNKGMRARNIWRTIRNAEMKKNMPMKTKTSIR